MFPTFRYVETNGVRLRVALHGDSGPLVILVHGWPESWYSWRHQMVALAEAGYRLVVPDMSVPYGGRPPKSPLTYYREKFGDRFFYML